MSPDPPARMPDIVFAFVRRLAGPPSGPPQEQLPRPSRDQVIQLVDQLLDAGATLSTLTGPARQSIGQAVRNSVRPAARPARTAAGRVASGTARPTGVRPAADAEGTGVLGVLPLGPIGVGETAIGELRVSNDSRDEVTLDLKCAPLSSSTGVLVPGSAVSVKPTPVVMVPRSAQTVDVHLTVPEGAAKGLYTGLLTATGRHGVRTLIVLEVE